MKILHIINSLATGGAEKLILDTIPKYNDAGIKADILLLNGTAHPFLEELKLMNCCEIFVLGESSPYQLKFIFKLIPYFKKYDLVHAHLFPTNYFAAAAKRISRSRAPLVMTEHNTSNRRFRSRKLLWLNKTVYKAFTKIVCITDEVKHVVETKAHVRHEKLILIYNGVDTLKFARAPALRRSEINPKLSDVDFLLVQVSSFREQKDQSTAIRALSILPSNIKLILVGEGSLRDLNKRLVQELSLEDRVVFLGNRSDVACILKASDVGILSTHFEGFGLAAVEGMASGRPFIGSDVPGLSEVVAGAGILFPQGDERKLAAEVLRLMTDKEYYQAIAASGKIRAAQYDIDRMVQAHIDLYRELTNS
ncbi:glycosyltransferase [Chryseobacterium sp. H3056]|uniref:Glycosyltransferase n=1 Tax=Kaistella daneshvariae TaxID=2487074 RepID=A0A3N0WYY9_9FLAO|nr:glycosyltransferase [Kaistella daneshvariae]ROI09219.1 glycosyltransferase [Kaistella daneshvariae]